MLIPSRRRRSAWAAGSAALALVLVVVAFGIRGPDRPIEVPSFLESSNRAVQAAIEARAEFWHVLAGLLRRNEVPSRQLWLTQVKFDAPGRLAAWQDGRQVRFLSFPTWTVPADPSWKEDPFHSRAWVRTYQSLAWLRSPARGFRETGDATYMDEIRTYVLDWIADNPRKHPAADAAWGDHATAYRTDLLVELFDPIVRSGAAPAEIETLLASLQQHGRVLSGFVADPRFHGTNHGLYHSMSLYSLANAFPELEGAHRWRLQARKNISRLLTELVERAEGISTEEAASYHYLALSLFARVNTYLSQFRDGLTGGDVDVLRRMVEFGALIVQPDGSMPATGDTHYGAHAPLALLRAMQAEGISTPVTDWILSDGQAGSQPSAMSAYPISGYALMREHGAAVDPARLMFDFGAFRRVHGHVDPLNVLLQDAGGPILIDSGGPYGYGDEGRDDFVAAQAHNLIVVDGRFPATGVPVLGPMVDSPALSSVEARVRLSGGVVHRRTVLWAREAGAMVIIDRLGAGDPRRHRFDLLFHAPPRSRVEITPWGAMLLRRGEDATRIQMRSSKAAHVDVVVGQGDLGWVTSGARKRTPAPVIRSRVHAQVGWFVTSIGLNGAQPALQVEPLSGGAMRLTLVSDGEAWRIALPADGAPAIERIQPPS